MYRHLNTREYHTIVILSDCPEMQEIVMQRSKEGKEKWNLVIIIMIPMVNDQSAGDVYVLQPSQTVQGIDPQQAGRLGVEEVLNVQAPLHRPSEEVVPWTKDVIHQPSQAYRSPRHFEHQGSVQRLVDRVGSEAGG